MFNGFFKEVVLLILFFELIIEFRYGLFHVVESDFFDIFELKSGEEDFEFEDLRSL